MRNLTVSLASASLMCTVSAWAAGPDELWQLTTAVEMSGTGQMTKSAKTMTGLVKMTTDGDQMTQTLSGKLVGTCTAATEYARVEQATAPPDKTPKKN